MGVGRVGRRRGDDDGERGAATYQSFHAPPQVTVRMAAAVIGTRHYVDKFSIG